MRIKAILTGFVCFLFGISVTNLLINDALAQYRQQPSTGRVGKLTVSSGVNSPQTPQTTPPSTPPPNSPQTPQVTPPQPKPSVSTDDQVPPAPATIKNPPKSNNLVKDEAKLQDTPKPAPSEQVLPVPKFADQPVEDDKSKPVESKTSIEISPLPVTSDKATGEKNAVDEKTVTASKDDKLASPEVNDAVQLFLKGDYAGAKKGFEEAHKKNPKLSPPGIFMAQFFSEMQRGSDVRFWLEQTTWEYPNDPEAYLLLADIALNENRLTETQLLVEKGSSCMGYIVSSKDRAEPLNSLAETIQATLHQTRQNWKSAKEHLNKLSVLFPDDSDIMTRLGFVSIQQGLINEGIDYYNEAIAAGAKLPTPKLIVAQVLEQKEMLDEAKHYFDDALKTPDLDATSYRIAAFMQLRWGDMTKAEDCMQKAIKAAPGDIENVLLAGTVAMYKKDYQEAEKQFQNAILLVPNHPAATNGLTLALAEQKEKLKLDRAIMYAKNNVQNNNQSADSIATLAWVFYQAGQMVEAQSLLNLATRQGNLSPINAYFLAEIANANGDTETALILLNIALSHKGNFMKKQESEELEKRLKSSTQMEKILNKTQ